MNDLISRQAAIDYCHQLINVEYQQGSDEMNYGQERVNQTETILHHLELMPSAQLERKKGEWIPVTNGRGGFECDQCHNYAPSYQDGVEWLSGFCPNCGADMRGEQDG